MQLVVKTLLFEEQTEEMHYESVEDVQLDDMSNTKQRQKLEQALIDYLIYMKGEDDECIEVGTTNRQCTNFVGQSKSYCSFHSVGKLAARSKF